MRDNPTYRHVMWYAALVGCATALAGLTFTNEIYTDPVSGEKSYIIKVAGDADNPPLTCPSDSKLRSQYNLGSIYIPGVSPLAYQNVSGQFPYCEVKNAEGHCFTYMAPEVSMGSELPDWWRAGGLAEDTPDEVRRSNQYKLIKQDDHLLLTGMFIPELELNGRYWWYNESAAGDNHKRPTFEETRRDVSLNHKKADLDLLMAELAAKFSDKNPEIDPISKLPKVDRFTSTSDVGVSNNHLGNLTGYKYAPTGVSPPPESVKGDTAIGDPLCHQRC
ncbi:MAG: hypothetical protein ACPGR8_17280 [Limisphaerales bacterium]